MATYPTNGYTPEVSERTKLRNEIKACIEIIRDARSGGDAETASYWECRLVSAQAKYNEYKTQNCQVAAKPFEKGPDGDALAIREKIRKLRFLLAGKKRDIASTTKLTMITMMQKDVQSYEAEITRLTALLPTGFGFRDAVDRHMNTVKGA